MKPSQEAAFDPFLFNSIVLVVSTAQPNAKLHMVWCLSIEGTCHHNLTPNWIASPSKGFRGPSGPTAPLNLYRNSLKNMFD